MTTLAPRPTKVSAISAPMLRAARVTSELTRAVAESCCSFAFPGKWGRRVRRSRDLARKAGHQPCRRFRKGCPASSCCLALGSEFGLLKKTSSAAVENRSAHCTKLPYLKTLSGYVFSCQAIGYIYSLARTPFSSLQDREPSQSYF